MTDKVPRIQLVGLLPAVMAPCGAACARPFMGAPLETLEREEREETPPELSENAAQAHDLADRLFRDFGRRIRIEVVGLDTPRGAWLGLRHRIGKGFAIVVDGRDVLKDPRDYAPLKKAVERALSRRTASA